MSAAAHPSRIGMAALILGVLLFSTVEVGSKLMQAKGAVAGTNPFWLACLRFVVTGILLAFPARASLRERQVQLTPRDLLVLTGTGLIGVTLMASLFHLGIYYLPANIAALIFSCNPVFVVLFAALMLSEKITVRKLVAALLCLVGVFVLGRDRVDGISLLGLLLMSGALLAFALYTVFAKKLMPRYGAPTVTALASLTGGLVLMPIAFAVEGCPFAAYGMADWLGITYLSVFGTALAFLLYLYGIGHVGAGTGSMAFFLKPFAAALFAWFVLGEQFNAPELTAGAFILTGMVVALAPLKARTTPIR
jgi:drug/metabolite transporter (DMT)-like permease